MITIIIRVKAA